MNAATTSASSSDTSLSTALAGLAAGAVGVWALDRLDWFLYRSEPAPARARTEAVREGGEAPAGLLVTRAEKAAGTQLSPRGHYLAELGVHYSIGIVPAIAYAVLRDRLPLRAGPVRGGLYGATLWLLQDEAVNPLVGLSAPPGDYPWQNHARALAAHVLYGITTEAVLNAMQRRGGSQAAPGPVRLLLAPPSAP